MVKQRTLTKMTKLLASWSKLSWLMTRVM